jgi:hypothetical protein
MKTVLGIVVAFVVGLVLAYYLGRTPERSPAPHPKETHEAVVLVEAAGSQCKAKTYSPVMTGRPEDDFEWKTVAVGECADYVADLQIATKNPHEARDLKILDTTPGASRRATVPVYPDRCKHQPPPCRIPYKVIVKSTDPTRPDVTEDPRVDIWP